jgi:hypothetical protein
MESQAFDWVDIIIKVLATSGAAAWIASMLTNKRGDNKVLNAVLDFVELIAGNIGKAKNDPNA